MTSDVGESILPVICQTLLLPVLLISSIFYPDFSKPLIVMSLGAHIAWEELASAPRHLANLESGDQQILQPEGVAPRKGLASHRHHCLKLNAASS